MKSKRGAAPESATASVATLILLIALFLIAYLIFLPSETRKEVLKGNGIDYSNIDNGNNNESSVSKEVLLLREPGTVLPNDKNEVKKDFASINLIDSTQKVSRKLADRITVSRTLFSDDYKDLEFGIPDGNLDNLDLFFNIVSGSGGIIIELNGNVIFEGDISVNDLPIKLPVENLQSVNKLTFRAMSPGWAFLSTNSYTLKDIELIKESSLVHKSELRTFEVSRSDAISNAVVEFFVNCMEVNTDQGILKVSLNRKNVFFGKVVCDTSQTSFDIPKDYFSDGTNYLTFEVDKGNYIIEQIDLKYKFDQGFNPQYFFTVDEDQFKKITDSGSRVKLVMKFDNNQDRKRAEIRVNGDTVFLDQNSASFEKDITKSIVEGENFIKIFAKDEFSISILEIDLIN